MTKNNSKDLTVGSPTGLILGFSLPLLLGMLFQQVYSLMDTIIVGRFLSVSALAAVGSTEASAFSSSASARVCVPAFHFL